MASNTNPNHFQSKLASVVCAGCSCLCDDIRLERDGHQIAVPARDSNLCVKGKAWLERSVVESKCRIDGIETDYEIATQHASSLLRKSRSALISSLGGLSVEGQQTAWDLADRMQASIDVSLSYRSRESSIALQRVGLVTSSLGEVAQRSDWILFWFCDAAKTHPRLIERFCRSTSQLVRRIVVVDSKETEVAERANLFIKLQPEQEPAALTAIRALISGLQLPQVAIEQQTGRSLDVWRSLAGEMLTARYGTIFTGSSGAESDFDSSAEQLHRMVRSLNQHTRFVLHPLRNHTNDSGAENVIAWSSGYPFAVNLNRSCPRYFGREYSAESLLERGECDLLVLGSTCRLDEECELMSPSAQDYFQRVPKIVLRESPTSLELNSAVEFPVTRCGDSCSGDMFRQDGISIPLPNLREADDRRSAVEVLHRLSDL